MNFNDFLKRNEGEIQEFRKDKELKDFITTNAEKKKVACVDEELRLKYETLKEHFKNFREIWTEDEIFVIYSDFLGISKKDIKKTSYLTAIKLERTQKAVLWMYLHLFSEKALHRGKAVVEFRKIFELV
jgi:hypothetical protein